MTRTLIRGGQLIDPSQNVDRLANLLLEDGKIQAVLNPNENPTADTVIVADGRIVAPGFVDLGTQLREPGFEEDETIESGVQAAVAGGFTTIACAPNTDPPIDSQASVEFVQHQAARADLAQVFVLASASKNREGQELSEMGVLAKAGAIGFSDMPAALNNSELMRRALEYAQMFDLPILNCPEVSELNRDGLMHEGLVSTLLGLPGMPAEAEDVMTARDIRLAEATSGRLHLLHLSSGGSCELLRRARARGVDVTAGASILNFVLSDDALKRFDTSCKVNPPLRSSEHIQACIEALQDGTLDVISSGHAPRAAEKKMDVLHAAPFGASTLETTLGLVGTKLVHAGHLSWSQAIAKLSCNPARIMGLDSKGSLNVGADADVVVFDPTCEWTVDKGLFQSKSSSSPVLGWKLHGRVTDVLVGGHLKRPFPTQTD